MIPAVRPDNDQDVVMNTSVQEGSQVTKDMMPWKTGQFYRSHKKFNRRLVPRLAEVWSLLRACRTNPLDWEAVKSS